MEKIFAPIKMATERLESLHKPLFFNLSQLDDKERLEALLEQNSNIMVFDTIYEQLLELIKIENPGSKLSSEHNDSLINRRLQGRSINEYGVWFYFPWSKRLVHLLDDQEFGKVRTNRNNYKITPEEQEILYKKKVGIIGLSIGHSIAMTLATEKSLGELRLADHDDIELSNLNRIQTGTHNIGVNKSIIAARAVAEIDPFINVRIYRGGISEGNIDDFLTDGGKLDALIEVCDGLDIKILARYKARAFKIPVIMDTSDKGMIDIERFDKEPKRPLLHGLLADLETKSLKNLTTKEKIPFVVKMIDIDEISKRLKASFIEVDQTITSWPQLASGVALGGAVAADTCRKVLLDADVKSGRYYVDVDKIVGIPESNLSPTLVHYSTSTHQNYDFDEFIKLSETFDFNLSPDRLQLTDNQIKTLCNAALLAPSGGNSQPCKWIVRDSIFFLFYDQQRSVSWLNLNNLGLYIALGAAIENVFIRGLELNIKSNIQYFPFGSDGKAVAAISFSPNDPATDLLRLRDLAKYIDVRSTNRNQGERSMLPFGIFKGLEDVVHSVPGCDIKLIDDKHQLDTLGEILSACDRIRLLTEAGHSDFYKEMRWSPEEATKTGDGVEAELLDLTVEDLVGLRVAKDWDALKLVKGWEKGRGLQKMTRNSIKSASAIALITVDSAKAVSLIEAGRCVERGWLYTTSLGIAVQPMYTMISLLQRVKTGKMADFSTNMQTELTQMCRSFETLFRIDDGKDCVFLLKLSIADEVHKKACRLPFNEVFHLETKKN